MLSMKLIATYSSTDAEGLTDEEAKVAVLDLAGDFDLLLRKHFGIHPG
jgi:hypothetical protein